jgi:hypothetical protein
MLLPMQYYRIWRLGGHVLCIMSGRLTRYGCLGLQLANAERRLAKRGLRGNFARARAFYRASCEILEAMSEGDGHHEAECAKKSAESESEERSVQNRGQHVRLSSCEVPDGDAQKSLGRALRSWARMEGFLGCAPWSCCFIYMSKFAAAF